MAPRRSWIPIDPKSHFSLANIPFGIISTPNKPDQHRPATVVGEYALDLAAFSASGGFEVLNGGNLPPGLTEALKSEVLNEFAALGRPVHRLVREFIQNVLAEDTSFPAVLKDNEIRKQAVLVPLAKVENHLPFRIGDYTDFYVGLQHAINCTVLMRGTTELQPNYRHLPVGYHGRASSVVVSGTPIRRPCGQMLPSPPITTGAAQQSADRAQPPKPIFGPCRRLDFELELGCFVARPNAMGSPVPIASAAEHLFGVVLMNDWSARDVQTWEMVPLGPFNAKNFGTSVSAWVVHMDALEPFMGVGLESERELLPYLREGIQKNVVDIGLEVHLTTPSGLTKALTKTSSLNLLFSFPQMLAHHTVGGCPFNPGDLMGSGTISGKSRGSFGSLFEQSEGGSVAIELGNGETRTFLEDGDTVRFQGVCGQEDGALVGFGICKGIILPAVKF